jgi:hypothetical protein
LTARWAAVLFVLVLLAACSQGEERSGDREPPPGSKAAIEKEFSPVVERLGLRITRAGLARQLGSRDYDPAGRHLAVYVEAVGPVGADVYVANLVPVAQAFLPEVFERFPQIESFDVCQEPPPGVDDRAEPKTWTQVLVTRQQVSAVDYGRLDLGGLLSAAYLPPSRLVLAVVPEVAKSPLWVRAVSQLSAAPPATSSTSSTTAPPPGR